MGNLGQHAASMNAKRIFFGSFDSDEHQFFYALSTQVSAANRENIMAFERWLNDEKSVRNTERLSRLNVGPSKSHIWQQLRWIATCADANHTSPNALTAAERDCAALVITRAIDEQHKVLDRAQLLSKQVFGDRYNDIFSKAHAVIGPSEPVVDWPVLLAA